MSKFKAAIFDVDGVMIDSGPLHMEAWKIVLQKAGIPFESTTFRQTFGMRNTEIVPRLVGLMDDDKVEKLKQKKEKVFQTLITKHGRPVEGLENFIAALQKQNITTAIASSAPREVIETILTATALADKVRIVISGEQAMRGKPAPDIFLMAAYRLNIETTAAVVFEDAVSGIEAARAAGATVVALTTSFSTGQLSHADLVVKNFTDPQLLKLFTPTNTSATA